VGKKQKKTADKRSLDGLIGESPVIPVRLPPQLIARLAKVDGGNRSLYIRKAVEAAVARDERKKRAAKDGP
jgi:hypothetical protein